MTTPSDEMERQIEQATGDDESPETALDGEATRLRETWLTLGQLLDTAQPEHELPPCPVECWESDNTVTATSNDRPRTSWLGLASAPSASALAASVLAACLLVAIAGVWFANEQAPRKVANSKVQPPAGTDEVEMSALADAQQALAWDDSLDGEFLYAWSQVGEIQSDFAGCDMIQASAAGYVDQLQQDFGDENTM